MTVWFTLGRRCRRGLPQLSTARTESETSAPCCLTLHSHTCPHAENSPPAGTLHPHTRAPAHMRHTTSPHPHRCTAYRPAWLPDHTRHTGTPVRYFWPAPERPLAALPRGVLPPRVV